MKRKRQFDEAIMVSIDRATKQRVEHLARKEERPVGQMARLLIRQALDTIATEGHADARQPAGSAA